MSENINYCSIDDCKKCNKYKCTCFNCIVDCGARFYETSGSCADYIDWLTKITRAKEIEERKRYWWKFGYY